MKGSLTGFLEKNPIWGNKPFWAQKNAHPHSSGSAGIICLKFCAMKGANRKMRMMSIIFPQKKLFAANGPFCAQKWHILITLDPV